MSKSSGWIGEGNFPHNKKKTAGIRSYSEDFDALVGEIPHQGAAELSGVIYSLLT